MGPPHDAFRKCSENRIHWEQGTVYDLSWSSDGTLLTAAGSKGPVRSWRLGRGGHKEGEEHRGLGDGIERLAWCPAAQCAHVLAAAEYEKTVHLWDQRSGGAAARLATGRPVSDVRWSPDGRFLAVAARDEGIDVFDPAQPLAPVFSADAGATVEAAAWSADARLLLLATHAGAVEAFAWPTMEHVTAIPAHTAACNALAVDPRGGLLATGSNDATLELWSADDLSLAHTIAAHDSPLMFAGFSMDGRFVASASDDPELRIHDTFSAELAHSLPLDAMATALEWHPRNLALAYGTSASSKTAGKPALTVFL
ncbi:THO complex subunit 3 [Coemansia javaensis]|uniref:THO complex subunit 3 n=1 Tax=Coemansia javaensis TaxID=2761396 RepID=A0A9W8HA60_9FUNG|nr:THO complex subunit 3 [Coemansia javaensis]